MCSSEMAFLAKLILWQRTFLSRSKRNEGVVGSLLRWILLRFDIRHSLRILKRCLDDLDNSLLVCLPVECQVANVYLSVVAYGLSIFSLHLCGN